MKVFQGIPFRLHVTKASDRRRGLLFARYEPIDDALSDRIRTQLDRKAQKLAKYHVSGKTTVLLVEIGDLALMNTQKILDALRRAYPDGLPSCVDRLWYADTANPDDISFEDFTKMLSDGAGQQHD